MKNKLFISLIALLAAAGAILIIKVPKTEAQVPPPSADPYLLCKILKKIPCPTKLGLIIQLPPNSIYTPSKLLVGNQTYTFSGGAFTPTTQGKLRVATTSDTVSVYPAYNIWVTGFQSGNQIAMNTMSNTVNNALSSIIEKADAQTPPPATTICFIADCTSGAVLPIDYRLTFTNPSLTAATKIANDLSTDKSKITDALYLNAKADCSASDHTVGSYLCLESSVSFAIPKLPPVTKYLTQSINALPPGVVVSGNVAAAGKIANLALSDPNTIAVGGTVSVVGGHVLPGYQNTVTQLSWANVGPVLTTDYNKKSSGLTTAITSFSGTTWNLNSTTNDPTNGGYSSSSSAPEGQLWNVDNHVGGGLTFNVSGGLTFKGRGTIVVAGDVNFTGSGNITCSNGDFGIIAHGSITFASGITTIGCGAYVALNGNINLNQVITTSPTWNAIFVASNNIVLPSVTGGTLTLNYDSAFADNPTALFTDILTTLFSSTQ